MQTLWAGQSFARPCVRHSLALLADLDVPERRLRLEKLYDLVQHHGTSIVFIQVKSEPPRTSAGLQALTHWARRLETEWEQARAIIALPGDSAPDKDTVPPIVKANLEERIALQVSSHVNSKIILDQTGAERLLGKGDLLASLGKVVLRCGVGRGDERLSGRQRYFRRCAGILLARYRRRVLRYVLSGP